MIGKKGFVIIRANDKEKASDDPEKMLGEV